MATQPVDEVTRRRHRQTVEAYLEWHDSDPGPVAGRRGRYENQVGRVAPADLAATRAGLDQFARYRELVARTLLVEG